MKRIRYIYAILALLIGLTASAATPAQIFESCVAKLRGAKSIKADFSLTAQGRTLSGTLVSKGEKFAVTTGGNGTWYDGRDLWVYTPSSGEVTVWKPVRSELAESNPLLYLSTAGDYNVASAAGAAKGESALTLTPKRRSAGVKSIRVVINSSTSLPKSMEITTGNGVVKVNVKSLQLGTSVADSSFTFPKGKYPKVKITDLR